MLVRSTAARTCGECGSARHTRATCWAAMIVARTENGDPKESIQGHQAQDSERHENTILTRDEGTTTNVMEQPPLYHMFASSEAGHEYPHVCNRFVPMEPIVVQTIHKQGDMLVSYYFPEFVYSHFRDANILLPLTSYVYAEIECELRFVVNANKFHCGRLVAAYRTDCYGFELVHNTETSALSRPHVLIDLAANVEATLRIPFQFHRALMRTTQSSTSSHLTRTGYCALVTVHVLSPLKSGSGAPNEINIRPMFRLTRARFYGMSHRVEFQMDTLRKVVDVAAPPPLRRLLRGIEVIHDVVGPNFDKPGDYTTITMVPQPLPGMCWGKGPTQAFPLRLSPSGSTVACHPNNAYKTTLDIARIWGCYRHTKWPASAKPGARLFRISVDPTSDELPEKPSRVAPTPLEFVCGMYNFWAGTIEFRIDFISNSFHTGAVMIVAEFERYPDDNTVEWKTAQNAYTKTFHLGEQRSVEFTMPYIYDNVWQRSNVAPYNPYGMLDTSPATGDAMHFAHRPEAFLSLYVVNELRPPETTTQEIDVMVFWRASPSFRVHGLCQSSYVVDGHSDVKLASNPRAGVIVRSNLDKNAHSTGVQLRWKDIVSALNSGRAAAPSANPANPQNASVPKQASTTEPQKHQKREAEDMTVEYTIREIYNEDELHFVEGIMPEKDVLCVRVHERPGRAGYEYYTARRELVRTMSYTDKYNGSYYEILKVVVPRNPSLDEHVGWVRISDYVPHTQNDGVDPTVNFQPGLAALHVQTTEDQTSLKDIFRRPILIYEKHAVNSFYNFDGYIGFFVPVTSPDYFASPSYVSDSDRLSVGYCPGLEATPQAALMSLFRFWRGTTRYTILVHDNNPAPVYVTYMPKSGTHLFGNIFCGAQKRPNPIFGGALSTHMIIPSINPAVTVEVPYDNDNLWCLTNVAVAHANAILYRDRSDVNNGHVVITSTAMPRDVSIWWSAGDDFEVDNYYGIPKCISVGSYRSAIEPLPKTQADYIRNVKKGIKSMPILAEHADVVLAGAESTIQNVNNLVNKATSSMETLATSSAEVLDEAKSCSAAIKEAVESTSKTTEDFFNSTKTMIDYVRAQVDMVMQSTAHFMTGSRAILILTKDLVLDISVAIVTKSWYALSVGLLRAITTVVEATSDMVAVFATQLSEWFQYHLGNQPRTQADGKLASLTGIIAGILGATLGAFVNDHGKYESRFEALMGSLTSTSTITYVNGVIRLMEKVFVCMQDMVKDWLIKMDPEARALSSLCENSAEVDLFVKEAQRYTLEVNTRIISTREYRTKVWMLVLQAHMFQRALLHTTPNKATNGLNQACRQVIKFADEHHIDLTSSPCRFEPYVLTVFGPPGIGKSYMTADLCSDLLSHVGHNVSTADLIYTRPPGQTFWDGFRNQPVIVYDDFGNLTTNDQLADQVSEIYKLKTPAEFIANMASLNDKGIRGTPILVVMNANEDFPPKISNVCSDKTAVYRRRDALIQVRLKEGYDARALVTANPEDYLDYPHLQFCFHKDPSSEDAGYEEVWYNWDVFREELRSRFSAYYQSKMMALKLKVKRMINATLRTTVIGEVVDPYSAFWDLNTLMDQDDAGQLPSDSIQRAVENTLAHLNKLRDDGIQIVDDKPQTQGIGLAGILMGFSLAAMTSESVTAYVGAHLKRFNQWIWGKSHNWHPIRTCAKCLCRRECALVCTGPDEHWMCMGCGTEGHNECPHCAAEFKGVVTEEGRGILVWISQFVSRLSATTATAFCDLSTLWGCEPMRVYTAITRMSCFMSVLGTGSLAGAATYLGSFVAFTFLPRKGDAGYKDPKRMGPTRAAPFGLLRNVATKYDCVTIPKTVYQGTDLPVPAEYRVEEEPSPTVEEPEPQSDEVFYDTSDFEIPMTQADIHVKHASRDIYSIQVTDAQVDAWLANVYENAVPCQHHLLVENVDGIRYSSGHFYVPDTEKADMTKIVFKPCKYGKCCFHDRNMFVDFLRTYAELHHDVLAQHFNFYYNCNGSLNCVANSVPDILIPKWIKHPIEKPCLRNWAWWEHVKTFCEKHKKFFSFTGLAAAALASIAVLWKFFPSGENPMVNSGVYDVGSARHLRSTSRTIKIVRGQATTQNEAMTGQTIDSVIKNIIIMTATKNNESKRSFLLQGIRGHYAILPKHYVAILSELAGEKYSFTIEPAQYLVDGHNHLRQSYKFDRSDFGTHPDTDLAWFRTPASYRMLKDISKLFWREEDVNRGVLSAEATIVAGPTQNRHCVLARSIELGGYRKVLTVQDDFGKRIDNRDVLSYNYSERGACGSLIVASNTTRPLVAMHTAGLTTGTGYGTILTFELLSSFIPNEVHVQSEEVALPPLSDTAFVIDDLAVALDYVGELPPQERPHVPSKTKIRKSAIHGLCGLNPATEPCILHKSDPRYEHPRSPLYYGVAKHGLRSVDFPSSVVRRVRDALYAGWFGAMAPVVANPRRLSYSEAILGFPGIPYYDAMKMSTSAGYPWTQKGRGTTKADWVHIDRSTATPICRLDPCLLEELQRKEVLRKGGTVPMTIFVDTLKDERRKPAKVRSQGGTRVFCASPIDYTIATRQNLLHFCAAMMKARFGVMSAVGINPKGTEWTKLHDILLTVGGGKVFQLDYSNFGPAFNAVVAEAAADIICMWTMENVDGVNEAELKTLLRECIQSHHVAGGTVYRQFCGSPSGAAITTIINSLVNILYVALAWLALVGEALPPGEDVWETFRRNVQVVVYGDDLIGAVSDKYSGVFNAKTISEYLATHGIVATDAVVKGTVEHELTSLKEAEFLKRGFRPHPTRPGYILAPLRWDSVNDATQWVWSSPDIALSTRVNCLAALSEAHGHGPNKFLQFRKQINQALAFRHIEPTTLEWGTLDQLWFTEGISEDYAELINRYID